MKLHLCTASALALSLSSTAFAAPKPAAPPAPPQAAATEDPAQNDTVGDIVVTAQRRSENIQNVPIAISAFSADQLRASGVSSALDIGQLVPNLIAQNNTGLGSANAYYLRGLGNTETIATFDPPVGTYVDDIYLSRQNANNLNLFDVERVEVLRGPQGTLFGRNTTGGAVNVILREPGKSFGGYIEGGYGAYNKKQVRGSVDIPLADTFQIKVSGYWQDDNGYTINNITHQRLNDDDGWGLRLGAHGDLSPNVRWNGSYAFIEADGENILNFTCDPNNPANCNGRFSTTGLSKVPGAANFAGLGVTGRKAGYGLGNRTATNLVTSNLAIDVAPDTTLSLITGFVNQTQQYALDFYDGRSGPTVANPLPAVRGYARGAFTILNDGKVDQFSQEVKLNGKLGGELIDYVAGFYYLKENNTTDFADVFSLSAATALLLGDRTLKNSTEAFAGYAQGDLNITDKLKFTAGIRYTDETKTLHYLDHRAACAVATPPTTCLFDQNFFVAANGTTVPANAPIPLTLKTKQWTPRFAINYKLDADILLYASATRGFKSGGWNARGYTPSAVLPFSPETVWSYEGGIKSEFFDHRLRANITVYHEDVSNLQTPSGIVNPTTGAISFVTRNFADYQNTGVEAEFSIVPTRGLNLYVNVGYQNDGYVIDRNAPAFDRYGVQSVAAQQAACRTQLAAGQVPGTPSTAPTGTPANNAPACGAGIVTAQGNIATPVRTPDFTVALGGSYDAPIGRLSLTPSVNASYHTDQEVSTANLSVYSGAITGPNGTFNYNPNAGSLVIGSFSRAAWVVNAGLALNGPDKQWQLSVQCTNCFDSAYTQSALVNTTYFNAPRSWTVRGRFAF
ncbi:TonB-dependent receptor [Sphingomonas sp. 28-63-12]|uniref:TonB-dependent receptor n=1 Tax=Sphingomonas sp. 28-63-12 TaxID=1970434 RepID=UPI000BCDCEFC|nr:MAG: TonB-dependent receptor [Sphingomonas sp. 28-63-12]